jgi:hypothetical protein
MSFVVERSEIPQYLRDDPHSFAVTPVDQFKKETELCQKE